jgi:hypothetical protein
VTRDQALLQVVGRVAVVLVGAAVAWSVRAELRTSLAGYRAFLLAPWKVVTFLLALAVFVFAAPYTGDPTWDWADGATMSTLTFLSAPWALGTLVRLVPKEGRPRTSARLACVAVVVWLTSASFSYDLYLWLRDGAYPPSWASNVLASSVLYAAAGGLWSLGWRAGRGVHFAFQESTWDAVAARSWRVLAWALVPIGLVLLLLAPFVLDAAPVVSEQRGRNPFTGSPRPK